MISYVEHNISGKSHTTVKYGMKMVANICEVKFTATFVCDCCKYQKICADKTMISDHNFHVSWHLGNFRLLDSLEHRLCILDSAIYHSLSVYVSLRPDISPEQGPS